MDLLGVFFLLTGIACRLYADDLFANVYRMYQARVAGWILIIFGAMRLLVTWHIDHPEIFLNFLFPH